MSRFVPPRPSDAAQVADAIRDMSSRTIVDSFTWDPPNVGAGASVDTTITTSTDVAVRGIRAGSHITLTPPSDLTAGLLFIAWSGTDDTLTVRLTNITGSPINQGSGTWVYKAMIV
jgi:hypothetical protein